MPSIGPEKKKRARIVLASSSSAPIEPDSAVEVPLAIKERLGLDGAQSPIVIAEGDEFVWPGYDLRKIARADSYEFGVRPPRFFKKLLAAFRAYHEAGTERVPPRD